MCALCKHHHRAKDGGEFVLPPLETVGLYATDPAVPGYEQVAVNLLDPNESNLLPGKVPAADPGTADDPSSSSSSVSIACVGLAICSAGGAP